jgi:hypothetical protein
LIGFAGIAEQQSQCSMNSQAIIKELDQALKAGPVKDIVIPPRT